MPAISMRFPEEALRDLDRRAALLNPSRTEYIRAAVQPMNRAMDEQARNARIRKASLRVRCESLKVNVEFARTEHGPD